MIISDPYGGLGNQLFGYAFARAVQEQSKDARLFILKERFQIRTRNNKIPVDFFADFYKLDSNKTKVIKSKLLGWMLYLWEGVHAKIYKIIFSQNAAKLTDEQFYNRAKRGYISCQNTFSLCDNITQLPLNAPIKVVAGLFQWPQVFLHLKNELQNELTLKDVLSPKAQEILEHIKMSESVCVHIRRGDYLQFKSLQVCNYEYYCKAMEHIADQIGNPVFFIFSDDIDWVEQHYAIPYNHVFVKIKHAAPHELELMRNCKHFVMSNSTFSWWAQFLSDNVNAVVVAPNPWFTDGRKASVYLPHWYVIDSTGGID